MFPGQGYDTRPVSFGASLGQDESYFQSPFSHTEWGPSNVAFPNLPFLSHHGCQEGFWAASTHPKAGPCSTESPPGAQPGQCIHETAPPTILLLSFLLLPVWMTCWCCAMKTTFLQNSLMWNIKKTSHRIALTHLEIHHSWDSWCHWLYFLSKGINVSYLAIHLKYVIKPFKVVLLILHNGGEERAADRTHVTGRTGVLLWW